MKNPDTVIPYFISVAEATNIIRDNVPALIPVPLPLMQASALTTAEPVYSPIDFPAWPQSSMDGYAIRFAEKAYPLRISGEIAAGATSGLKMDEKSAIRIFTGAPVPEGADTVVMQEKVNVKDGSLHVEDPGLKEGDNLRRMGAEIRKGELAVPSGTVITSRWIGFLSSLGITSLLVYPPPSVSIILTGNELLDPGNDLLFGQVYDANSAMLTDALYRSGVVTIHRFRADDELDSVQSRLSEALEKSDLVLLAGGVSVGDYDFVIEAAKNCHIESLFYKVRQKPGKPLFFGKKKSTVIFGLPGNPASALTCFYIYVVQALDQMMSRQGHGRRINAKLSASYARSGGLTHFLKARLTEGKVILLQGQESFRLHSFAEANCLAEIPEDRTELRAGESLVVHLLPD
ncbi:MAG TPA: gephyrin-like molybdotransferase Glp [Flavitalea sp.]|nr:gephyrin-like molybdotransferase Glp [Flavitalea sp.]